MPWPILLLKNQQSSWHRLSKRKGGERNNLWGHLIWVRQKYRYFWSQHYADFEIWWIWILAQPFMSCMTLRNIVYPSWLLFFLYQVGMVIVFTSWVIWRIWWANSCNTLNIVVLVCSSGQYTIGIIIITGHIAQSLPLFWSLRAPFSAWKLTFFFSNAE